MLRVTPPRHTRRLAFYAEGMSRGQGAGSRLSDTEYRAWRGFLRAHSAVVRRLEADLLREHGLPLAWYDVLVQLVEAPEHELRMTELAERVLVSRSGLTRLVDRMAAQGLVTRRPCESDARGYFAVLTPEGFERLREAAPTHLAGVRDYAIGGLSEDELAELGRLMGRFGG